MLIFQIRAPLPERQDDNAIPADVEVVGIDKPDERPPPFNALTPEGLAIWGDWNAKRVYRGDFKTFEDATRIASSANRYLANGTRRFIPVDAGPHTHPRFDVIEAFKVGDAVSYSFNGDTYPDGEIIKIGGGRRETITTSTGRRYNRYKLTGSWRSAGTGTWALCRGHIYEQNPSF